MSAMPLPSAAPLPPAPGYSTAPLDATATIHAVAVPIFDLESYRQLPGYAEQTSDRMGAWHAGVFDCLTHNLVPNCCMVTLCPWVSLAQVFVRIGCTDGFGGLVVLLAFPWVFTAAIVVVFVLPTTTGDDLEPKRHLSLVPIALANLWLWQGGAVFLARRKVRQTFQIEEEECGEDLVLSCLCTSCVQAQIATHAKSYTPHACSFARPDTLPPFQAS